MRVETRWSSCSTSFGLVFFKRPLTRHFASIHCTHQSSDGRERKMDFDSFRSTFCFRSLFLFFLLGCCLAAARWKRRRKPPPSGALSHKGQLKNPFISKFASFSSSSCPLFSSFSTSLHFPVLLETKGDLPLVKIPTLPQTRPIIWHPRRIGFLKRKGEKIGGKKKISSGV